MKLKAGIQSATIFIALGFLSLVASIALFVDRSSSTKLGPSLVRGILDGFGMLWLDILSFLAAFTLLHAVAGWALYWLARPFLEQIQDSEKKRRQTNLLILLLAFLVLVLEAASRFPHTLLGSNIGDLATAAPGLVTKWALGLGLALVLG